MDERNSCPCSPKTNQSLQVKSQNTYTSFFLSPFHFLLGNTSDLINSTTEELETEIAELEKYQKELVEQKLLVEQEILQNKVEQGIQELETLAEQINTLSSQLEANMLKFKEIAAEVNSSYHKIQQTQNSKKESQQNHFRPLNIWEVHFSSIPTVIRLGAKFILTAKIVNLFKAESETDAQTNAQINAQERAETAQKRRKALERWLTEQKQQD